MIEFVSTNIHILCTLSPKKCARFNFFCLGTI